MQTTRLAPRWLFALAHLCAALPAPSQELDLAAPIERWDEALPLGNGTLGGLLWGAGCELRLSLDKSGLWDLRQHPLVDDDDWNYATLQRLVRAGDQAELVRRFDGPYSLPWPTKLPGGRLVLTLPEGVGALRFRLDLARAEARVEVGDEAAVRCLFDARSPVALLEVPLTGVSARFLRPDSLARLDYPDAQWGAEGELQWMVQEGVAGDPLRPRWAVVVGQRERDGRTLVATTLVDGRAAADPLAEGRRRVEAALARGYEAALAGHLACWSAFWARSSVALPDERLQRHYDLVRYFYGAASRRHTDPMPLQGVWTADSGDLPPWKGDYHNDLNTQATYGAYGAAGHFEEGLAYLDYHWRLRERYRRFAREFYGVEGLIVPGVADGAGNPIGGWGMYALSPTHTAWIAQIFDRHWRLTADRAFLAERAYPFTLECAEALLALLAEDEHGHLVLPLSSSPEVHDNSLAAWLTPNSNYDNALLHTAFEAAARMARELDEPEVAARMEAARARLQPWHLDDRGGLMFARGEPFAASHRHHSHLMALHPFELLTVEGGAAERAIVDASLAAIERHGTQAWVGYSFSWMACLLARAGRADEALRYLVDYERAFTLRNGFHANGDQLGAGLSGFRYRPFTLEGNFLAMEAVHQMLLQSWGGRVRVFPAVPEAWAEVAFTDLRAEGGFRVSATRAAGRTTSVRVSATVDAELRLRDPFPAATAARVEWSRPVRREDGDLLLHLAAGQELVGSLAPPTAPTTYGAVPSARQLRWHERELYAFLHFTTNTFTDREWGYGDESPDVFAPTAFDPDQITGVLAEAGFSGVILTAKHHDGFCLWPTATTEYDVASSAWRGGAGDVVGELQAAAERAGLAFGVYVSPWDRNSALYGTPEYVTRVYRPQLAELLTNYGDVFEVWFDGANGGDGYYGGARESRQIDRATYYDWPTTWQLVRDLAPDAVMFSDVGPDCRWVGNERGVAGDPSWATYTPRGPDGSERFGPGMSDYENAPTGTRDGRFWLPAECDVSIRPGWFWHASQDGDVRSPADLMELYLASVGRGANFLLNVPPDRRGRLHENDVASLRAFGAHLRATFATDLTAGAELRASNVRGGDASNYGPQRLLDDDRLSAWVTDDFVTTPWVELELPRATTFDLIRLREDLRLGQRVAGVAVDAWLDGAWTEVASAASVGACRLWRVDPVTTTRVRVRVTSSPVCPALSDLGLYDEPELGN